jgi:hypothetical protein
MTDDDLERRLADWMADVAPRTTPAILHEPAHRLAARPPAARPPAESVRPARAVPRPLPAMAIAATLIILAVLALRGSPTVSGPGSSGAAATATARTTSSVGGPTARAPSPVPVTRADWTSVTWSLIDPVPFAGPGNQFIQGFAALDDEFVAVGYETGVTPTAIVWVGGAGEPWTRVADPSRVFEDSIIDRVAVVPGGLIAIGRPGSPDGAPGVRLWRTADGRTWTRSRLDAGFFGNWHDPGLEMTSGPGGLIAFDRDRATGATRIWHSPDGEDWAPDPAATTSFGGARLWIVGTPTGYLATGARSLGPSTDTGLGPDSEGVAFRSADGRSWSPSLVDGTAHGLGRAFVARDGLLVDGSSHGPTNAIILPEYWHSTDGAHWEPVEHPGTDEARLGLRVAADGDRIYALSPYGSAWSTDGLAWHRLDEFVTSLEERSRPWNAMYQVAAGSGGIVASGQTTIGASGHPDDQTDALVWQAVPGREPPDSAVMPTPPPVNDTPCPTASRNPDGTCG